jgi:hypothetical protein
MKRLLPLLIASAAVSHAQTVVKRANTDDRFAVSLDSGAIMRDVDDFDALALGAKARVADNLRVTLAYVDASSDPASFDTSTLELDATRVALGLEYDIPAGPGAVTFSLAYARTTAEASGDAVGDAFDNNQLVLGARYERRLVGDFSLAVTALHFVNDYKGKAGFADAGVRDALVARYDDSPTSLGASLLYSPTRLLTFHLTYATEDSLLGLGNADATLSFGVKVTF